MLTRPLSWRWLLVWVVGSAGLAFGQTPQFVQGDTDLSYRVTGTIVAPAAALAAGEVRLLFDYADANNYYALTLAKEQARFVRVKGGQMTPLGVAGAVRRSTPPERLAFSLVRSDWGMTFVCNQVVSARAEDRELAPGKVGWLATGAGLAVEGMSHPQVTEELFFSDDFMRTDEQLGGWEPAFGKWENNQQGSKVSRSANAFSFRSKGGTPALAVHGNAFDHDYVVQAAVRCDNDGAVGLAVGYQDERNYYLLKWTAAAGPDGGTCRLQRVFGGTVTDITPPIPGGFRPEVWYKLQLSQAGGWIYGWIDDVPLFEVAAQAFGEGKIGIYTAPGPTEDEKTAGALFDDVVERSWPLFCDDFSQPSAGRWTAVGPAWDIRTGTNGLAAGPPAGLLLCGAGNWQNAQFESDVSYDGGNVGLVACQSDKSPGFAAVISPTQASIVKLGSGGKQVLASTAKGLPTGGWHRLAFSAEEGLLRLTVDGESRLEGYDATALAGRCGLYTDGAKEAKFTNVRCLFRPTFFTLPPTLPAEFVQDRYMTAWASPGAAWIQVEGSTARWHKGFFYGDRKVHFQIPGFGKQDGRVTIALGSKDTDKIEGYRLVVEVKRDQKAVGLRLLEGDKELATAKPTVEGESAEVVFELRGRFILVVVGGQTALEYGIPEVQP